MAKSSNRYARIELDVKEQAEAILNALGIFASTAMTMFYKQIILQRGILFEVKLPAGQVVDMSARTESQLHEELEKGYYDMLSGRTGSADSAFARIRGDYGI